DADVCERVSRDGDDIGEITGLQRADLPLPAEYLCAVDRAGLKSREWRHAVLDHELEFTGLRAVREGTNVGTHGDGDAGGKLLREILRVYFQPVAFARALRRRGRVIGEILDDGERRHGEDALV